MARCGGYKFIAARDEEWINGHYKSRNAVPRKGVEGRIDLGIRACVQNMKLKADGAGCLLHIS